MRDQLQEVFFETYGTQDHITMVIDLVQSTLKCCGVDGPADWAESVYNTGTCVLDFNELADESVISYRDSLRTHCAVGYLGEFR